MEINVHELINLPHGEANKKLKEAGKWDESKSGEEGEREWIVTVDVSYIETDTVRIKVFAIDEDDAMDKAEEEASNKYDDVETVEARKAERP